MDLLESDGTVEEVVGRSDPSKTDSGLYDVEVGSGSLGTCRATSRGLRDLGPSRTLTRLSSSVPTW